MTVAMGAGRAQAQSAAMPSAPEALADTTVALSLREVQVTAARAEPGLGLAETQLITRAQIERHGAITLPELLAQLPGVQGTSHGGANLYLRGTESRMTALYIDGVRVESHDGMRLGGGAPWEMIPLSQIERIEVVQGPASALYGSDAMAGVVRIWTRRGAGQPLLSAGAGLGSQGLRRVDGAASGASGDWDYALRAARSESQGYNSRPDVAHSPARQPHDETQGSARLGWQISQGQRLELSHLISVQSSQSVPWSGGDNTQETARLQSTGLRWRGDWSAAHSTQAQLGQSVVAAHDTAKNDHRSTVTTLAVDHRWRSAFGTLNGVVDVKRDAFEVAATDWTPALSATRRQWGYGLGYGHRLGAHSLQVHLRRDSASEAEGQTTGRLAYGYDVTDAWSVAGTWASAYRLPTLEQRYGPYGRSALAPEQQKSAELSLRWQGEASSARLTHYQTDTRDLISSSQTLTDCAAGWFCYYNVGQARVRGTTLQGQMRFAGVNWQGSVDQLDPRNRDTGKQLSLRARQSAALSADTEWMGWQVGGQWRAVGQRYNNAANTETLGGYAVVNLWLQKQWVSGWSWLVRVDNVFDKAYQDVQPFVTPGRKFYTGLRWQG